MAARRSLPVIVPRLPEQRFSCHGCANCCRDLAVHLTRADRARLDAQGWSRASDRPPYVRLGRGWVLNQTADHRCLFLLDNNQCRIHAEHGPAAKPLGCQLFPFVLLPVQQGWRLSLRFDCPTVARSQGAAIQDHLPDLRRLSAELPAPPSGGIDVELRPGRRAAETEVLSLVGALDDWLKNERRAPARRVSGLFQCVETLGELKLQRVHGAGFEELITVLFADPDAFAAGAGGPAGPPTARQRRLLRQQVFPHCEAISITEAFGGLPAKLRRMISQLRRSRQFTRLAGMAPPGAVSRERIAFASIEAVAPARQDAAAVAELVIRYLRAQVLTHGFYGQAYYGWPLLFGLQALLSRLAVWGWLARHCAAAAGATEIDQRCVVEALQLISRAAGISPALGGRSERLRLIYLALDHGLRRLWEQHPLFDLGGPTV